ncbi:DUF115 domain-containing protein [Pseudoalteromonas sp. SMS1]|uniref:motility associated factor glycosyltransferase family protein n=1 Tax=Pseudoalteromonas sp. SMS1 TaxID=2908894 RepID=UPI001F195CCD|nr:6-hydroxymethylpterin diphosphokinase MptE-like protein [Pseudoalteromonas sp. SMS1]MCF2859344.1 DUF115 domain-containing protein [Pseudoalteromonas sp. SMS1]
MELFNQNLEFLHSENTLYSAAPPSLWNHQELQHKILSFYGECARSCCEKQVKLFLKHPQHLSMRFKTNNQSDYVHQILINKMNDKANKLGLKPNSKPQRGTIVILGLAAGYHIEALMKSINYSDIIILEPSMDMLSMASHHISFEKLQAECRNRGGSLHLIHSKRYEEFERALLSITQKIGSHIVSDISLYRHYSTPLFDHIYENFKIWRNRLASLWGFMEDELVGLSHTEKNSISHEITGHNNALSEFEDIPLVIVGNGPSLDNDIDYLIENRNSFLIASCGTSLNPLLNNNITPDFHIEMERLPCNLYIKEEQVRDPRMKDVVLVALNTVYPKYVNLFDHRMLFPKANDLGAHVYTQNTKQAGQLYNCNPTVTNMALASLTRMGFKNIVLVGCDYGYIDPTYHHSKHSAYFEDSSSLSQSVFSPEIETKGNFRQSIYTDRIYNESRLVQQSLIKSNKLVSVINSSDGAYIEGTLSQRLSDINPQKINKAAIMCEIRKYAQHHAPSPINAKNSIAQATNILFKLKQKINQTEHAPQMLALFAKELSKISYQPEYQASHYLLSGTFKYVTTTVASHINHLPLENQNEYFTYLKEVLMTSFDQALEKLSKTQ